MFQVVREPAFAERVRASRKKLRLRQTGCANKVGVSRQHWNNWELGYCKPKGKRLAQMADVLQCDPDWLQHGDGGDADKKLENVMTMLRMAVRDLEHINRSLLKNSPPRNKARRPRDLSLGDSP